MSCEHKSLVDELLHGEESVAEILRILHRRNIAAHLSEGLREGRTAELLHVEREVDMIETAGRDFLHYRRDNLPNITHLSTCTDNDSSRSNNLVAVRIFLCHRQRVLTRRHVNL